MPVEATRVLVADDDPMSRAMVAAMLRGEGYEVEQTADGEAAWDVLQRADAPRIAILDWDMPGLAGIDLCRRLRTIETASPVYVILLTSRNSIEDMTAAFAAGADDYVVKPPRQPELLARLRIGSRIVALQEQLRQQSSG